GEIRLAGAVLLQALTARHAHALTSRRLFHRGVDERGLANARLSGDEHELSFAAQGALQPAVHFGELGSTAEQAHGGRRARGGDGPSGFVRNLTDEAV